MTVDAVLWLDAFSVDAWTARPDLCMDSVRIFSIGLVVKENDQTLALSVGFNTSDQTVACTLIIPKINILERKTIVSEEDVETWIAIPAAR